MKRVPSYTLDELKETVEALADFLEEEEVSLGSVTSVLWKQARVCQHINGVDVELRLGKVFKELDEN